LTILKALNGIKNICINRIYFLLNFTDINGNEIMKHKMITSILLFFSCLFSQDFSPQTVQDAFAVGIYKSIVKNMPPGRDVERTGGFVQNLASSAPADEVIIQFDNNPDLLPLLSEAHVFISTDNQLSWTAADCFQLGLPGYDETWECVAAGDDENAVYWYLDLISTDTVPAKISQGPVNLSGLFPPTGNLYLDIVSDPAGDINGNDDTLDILAVKGSYNENYLYIELTTLGAGFPAGDFFGPWFLYGAGISDPNPDLDADTLTVYSLGYGDGGFGNVYPGLLKLRGSPEGILYDYIYITDDIAWEIDENKLSLSIAFEYLLNDPDFGDWPNAYGGLLVSGMTASTTLELDLTSYDDTDPVICVYSNQFQSGNTGPVLTNPHFDNETGELFIVYSDENGNLPVTATAEVDIYSGQMLPLSHDYLNGAEFVYSLDDPAPGNYTAHFHFSDGAAETDLDYNFTIFVGECGIPGDVNLDGVLDVLDVVAIVSNILASQEDPCGDLDGNGTSDVLDIVALVAIILDNE